MSEHNNSDTDQVYRDDRDEDLVETRECPLCDWTAEKEILFDAQRLDLDERAELHYEREHCGRVRVQVTLEAEWMLHPGQDVKKLGTRALERFEDEPVAGFVAAYSRVETIEEPTEGGDDE